MLIGMHVWRGQVNSSCFHPHWLKMSDSEQRKKDGEWDGQWQSDRHVAAWRSITVRGSVNHVVKTENQNGRDTDTSWHKVEVKERRRDKKDWIWPQRNKKQKNIKQFNLR